MLLKDAGNDRHFSGNVADFSGNRADPTDDGEHLLLQKPFLLGLIGLLGSRKTQTQQMVQIGIGI